MGCFRCDNCGALNIAIAKGRPGKEDPLDWLASRSSLQWQPQLMADTPDHEFSDVPPQIADAAAEAFACREVADACRAAVLLARSVIEAVAKDKGITKGKLLEKIDAMRDMIRPHVREGAHEVRLFGNDVAHGDFVRDVGPEDADLVLTLMSEVLDDVYQSPARVKRAQDARMRRQQGPQASDTNLPLTNLPLLLNLMAQQGLASRSAEPVTPDVSIQLPTAAEPQNEQS